MPGRFRLRQMATYRRFSGLKYWQKKCTSMASTKRPLYMSQNGDRWWLLRDELTGRSVVRHEANQSSGGHWTETEVEDFLSQEGSGPEHVVLRRIIEAEKNAGRAVQ
jgi:hypothetical protein